MGYLRSQEQVAVTLAFSVNDRLVCRSLDRSHSALLANSMADQRILRLTKEEEKRLLLRLERITSLQVLRHMEQHMYEQLGIRVRIEYGASEVRTLRGIQIEVLPMRGLCSKTR